MPPVVKQSVGGQREIRSEKNSVPRGSAGARGRIRFSARHTMQSAANHDVSLIYGLPGLECDVCQAATFTGNALRAMVSFAGRIQ